MAYRRDQTTPPAQSNSHRGSTARLRIDISLLRRDSFSALVSVGLLRWFSCETFYLNRHFDLLSHVHSLWQINIETIIKRNFESILLEDHICDNSPDNIRFRVRVSR